MQHSPLVSPEKSTADFTTVAVRNGFLLLVSCFFAGLAVQSLLESPQLATSFVSFSSWEWIIVHLNAGELLIEAREPGHPEVVAAITPLWRSLLAVLGLQVLLLGPLLRRGWWGKWPFSRLPSVLFQLAGWWGLLGLWGLLWMVSLLAQWNTLAGILQGTAVFWVSLTLAGSLFSVLREGNSNSLDTTAASLPLLEEKPAESRKRSRAFRWVLVMMGLYVLVFTAMNWGLWFNLRLPHGDSAMYEEHLWNVLHGKGFRSYLDQGLFWGEHIQFVHLFLLPLYVLWPSHLLLELCESLALAAGAIPVFWLARRAGGERAGLLLSAAYLLYFPLQFLDIAIDLKTFRPIAFGIAPVLFAIDQLERRRFKSATALLLFSLTCKEDYSIVIFSIGVVLLAYWGWPWLRRRIFPSSSATEPADSRLWKYGLGYLVGGPVYLLLALRAIRWFRSGVEVHYAGYFTKFGNSTSEIIWNMLTNPALLLGELLTAQTLIYALALLVPLGFLPLRSPLKLLGCLPMFVLLCLNELAQDPRHHFHAPIIPLLFWAAVGGYGVARKLPAPVVETENESPDVPERILAKQRNSQLALWAVCCGLSTSLWFSLSPLGVAFWDSGSAWNAVKLYSPNERAWMFSRIENLIPQSARVASTDYVHPRFTHHERSYDYSNYARRVSGYELTVPSDTEYIVIDTRHPYSTIQTVEQVREMQQEPEQWEVLPDETAGYFIVLKRRPLAPGSSPLQ